MRRLPCAEHEAKAVCCDNLKLMFYVNYSAWNNDLWQFLGVIEVSNHDGINDKSEKENIWTLYGSSWDHLIFKYRDKKSDKIIKKYIEENFVAIIW